LIDSLAMTAELISILKNYVALERTVNQRMSAVCEPHCSVCTAVCCGPEYCRETIMSPFLAHLTADSRPPTVFCPKFGWLTSTGCALAVGKPPVCYQFSCSKIINALPDDHHRYHFQVLSELVNHIGKRALGRHHLVEIMDPVRLQRVNPKRIERRLNQAWNALAAIQSYSRTGRMTAPILTSLSKIVPHPRFLAA
jgi:hypothetical protein